MGLRVPAGQLAGNFNPSSRRAGAGCGMHSTSNTSSFSGWAVTTTSELTRSAVEDGQVQLPEPLGVGDDVDVGDLAVPFLEVEDDEQSLERSDYDAHGSVDKRRLSEPGPCREGQRPPSYGPRTVDLARSASTHGCAIGSNDDVGVENRDKRVEVAIAGGGEEGIDNFTLAHAIAVGNRGRALHTAPCAARELPCGRRGAVNDRGDLIEGHCEHVVEHEREPLG